MSGALATYPLATFPPAITLPAFDLIAADQPSVTDTVILIEMMATDGTVTVTSELPALATYPIGTLPITITGGSVQMDWSDADWTSSPDDSRASIHFPGLASGISIDRSLPLRHDGERRLAAAIADITIDNGDGAYDVPARALAIDGQAATISLLQSRASAYADRRTIFSGVGMDWRTSASGLRIRMRDLGYLLNQPMLGLYGGAGGADGGDDQKGKAIIEPWGICRNIALQQVDGALLIYRVAAREVQGILSVMESGAEIAIGSLRASYAVLASTPPTAGTWDWCITSAGSFIRLGSSPTGTITADVEGDASDGYSETLAGIMRRILGRAGVAISEGAFDSAEAFAPGAAGICFTDQVTYAEALTKLAAGGCLWWGDIGAGVISVGRVGLPTGSNSLLIDETVITGEVEPMEPPAPAWRVTASYRRNWRPLSGTDLLPAPTIDEERRTELSEAARSTAVVDSSRRARNAQAGDITIETLFDDESDAAALAQNVLDLRDPRLGLFRVPVGLAGYGLPLGSQAQLLWPRFGLANGVNVRVVGQACRGASVDLLVIG